MACGTPAVSLKVEAERLGLQAIDLNGDWFVLSCFHRKGGTGNTKLHIYLEGDGRPWEQGLFPSSDPTTRASVMLPLLASDHASVLYLARPCYNGHAADLGCNPRLWTSGRYAEQVVNAMQVAVLSFMHQYGYSELVLIGHSGGGSLAMLLAGRLPQTKTVVTLAGNYDIDAWADFHGYQRLNESLNPADFTNQGITEWHFLGELDRTVPAELFLPALRRRSNSRVEIIPAIDHLHGWLENWPEILSRIDARP